MYLCTHAQDTTNSHTIIQQLPWSPTYLITHARIECTITSTDTRTCTHTCTHIHTSKAHVQVQCTCTDILWPRHARLLRATVRTAAASTSDVPRDFGTGRVGSGTEADEVLVRLDGEQSFSVVSNTAIDSSKTVVDISVAKSQFRKSTVPLLLGASNADVIESSLSIPIHYIQVLSEF